MQNLIRELVETEDAGRNQLSVRSTGTVSRVLLFVPDAANEFAPAA